MSVNTTCGACGTDLVDGVVTTDAGAQVRVSSCPEGHGKIKSPMCCGSDMSCTV
jgi:hypothetical protein